MPGPRTRHAPGGDVSMRWIPRQRSQATVECVRPRRWRDLVDAAVRRSRLRGSRDEPAGRVGDAGVVVAAAREMGRGYRGGDGPSTLENPIQATFSRFNEARHTDRRLMRPNSTQGCSRDTRGLPRTNAAFKPPNPSIAIHLTTESFLHPLVPWGRPRAPVGRPHACCERPTCGNPGNEMRPGTRGSWQHDCCGDCRSGLSHRRCAASR